MIAAKTANQNKIQEVKKEECITFGRSANGKFLLPHGYLHVNLRKRR